MQAPPVELWYCPAEQAVVTALDEHWEPAGQGRHAVSPPGLYVPDGQAETEEEEVVEGHWNPAGQVVHVETPRFEYEPDAHGTSVALVGSGQEYPAGQSVHAVLPAMEYEVAELHCTTEEDVSVLGQA
jgi:hypothetical protein